MVINKINIKTVVSILLISYNTNLFAQIDTSYKYYPNGNIRLSHIIKYIPNADTLLPDVRFEEIKSYYENGQVKRKYIEIDNKLDSLDLEWYENGQKRYQFPYKMGKRHGVFLHWYETGELLSVSYYKEDKAEGTFYDFYTNGEISKITNYRNGISNGITIFFDEKGNIQKEGYFIDGKGVLKVYDENGKLTTEYFHNNYPNFNGYTKTYREDGYVLIFDEASGSRTEYYDKNNVKYKIVKFDSKGNKEVIDLNKKK